MRRLYYACLLLISSQCFAETREIAITIDDLPLVASRMNNPGNQQRSTERFMKIIQALVDNKVPATAWFPALGLFPAMPGWQFDSVQPARLKAVWPPSYPAPA